MKKVCYSISLFVKKKFFKGKTRELIHLWECYKEQQGNNFTQNLGKWLPQGQGEEVDDTFEERHTGTPKEQVISVPYVGSQLVHFSFIL